MSGSDWAAVIGAQACLVALVVLVVAIVRLDRAAAAMRAAAADFRGEAGPLLDELRDVVRSADFELDRIDALVHGAGRVTERVDAASDLAYRTIASPVVRALAVGTGTRQVVRRLRGDGRDGRDGRGGRGGRGGRDRRARAG
jgi:hypothetical protein